MSKKKMLVALGYYKKDGSVDKDAAPGSTEEIIVDLYFCQYCDRFFETFSGKRIHESRWCEER